jgi:hypothetical protein
MVEGVWLAMLLERGLYSVLIGYGSGVKLCSASDRAGIVDTFSADFLVEGVAVVFLSSL